MVSFQTMRLFNRSYFYKQASMTLHLLVLLAIFISACVPPKVPKNVTLFYKDNSFPAGSLLWSPRGDNFAIGAGGGVVDVFSDPPRPQFSTYIMDVKTKKIRPVSTDDFGDALLEYWTSDGKGLVFYASPKGSKTGMWLVDVNGIEPPKFLAERFQLTSANGKTALPQGNPNTQESSLYIRDDSTGEEMKVFSGTGVGIQSLSWSSDGSKLVILFETSQRGNYSMYVFDANTKKTTQVSGGNLSSPALSADGKMIAYLKGDQKSFDPQSLYIMKSDGSCDVEVPGHLEVFSPGWSPDGKQIAYVGRDEGIYLLDLVGAFGKDIVEEGLPCP